ncbi:hypothetical protein FEM48_Zijuj09G0199500 [Ziziphus jujuba var. spinosa]|uniref:DC1 domain-containing protein n=1 Tax=Ziziphus jujuba var. spinosa TaxID=714518 RepID=A0A978UV06_ZIZJJ|nr:hypothetical protein FEM48_Zijuj09G0199500 [Ziziphus jujuba var. spinosa]
MYAELLQLQITHPFHPKCRLFFQANHRKHACNSCKKGSYTFVFRCNLCHFNICVGYSYLSPTRKYEGHDHDHLLCFSELDRNHGICSAYHFKTEPCNILRCLECNFKVHTYFVVRCHVALNIKCHVHPLTPFDLVVEDDSSGYHCDAFEMRRNPLLRFYYCAHCKYIADVYCVLF